MWKFGTTNVNFTQFLFFFHLGTVKKRHVFEVCILFHLHLISSGLCSWIYLLIFSYRSPVKVDRNTELVVLFVTLAFAAWHRLWHRLYSWTILLVSWLFTFLYSSLHLCLRPHISLQSSSPLCYASYCIFLEGVAKLFCSSFLCCLLTLVDITLTSFYFWSIFI